MMHFSKRGEVVDALTLLIYVVNCTFSNKIFWLAFYKLLGKLLISLVDNRIYYKLHLLLSYWKGRSDLSGPTFDPPLVWNQQLGFRPHQSTETSLLQTVNECLVNMEEGLINGLLYLDLK